MNSSPIVVLGARIVDGRPSRMLHARLIAALVRWRIDARAGVERTIVVTSNFHVRRTRVWAWHLGIPVEMVPARTPRRSRAKNYAREVVALPHSAARVAWRRLAHTLGLPPLRVER